MVCQKACEKHGHKIKSSINELDKPRYEFTYKPDNSNLLKKAIEELQVYKNQRKKWRIETPIRDNGKKHIRYKHKPRHKPKHDKSNIIKL